MRKRLIAGLIAWLFAAALPTVAAAAERPKIVLLVFDEDSHLPGLSTISSGLRDTFRAELGAGVEFCTESLNLSRFRSVDYPGAVRDHFRIKYANRRPDLIVAVRQPALEFLLQGDAPLFPGVPIVFCGVDSSYLGTHKLPAGVTGVAVKRDYRSTLDIAMRLRPKTRHLYVVGGSGVFDRRLQGIARHDLATLERRLSITYLTAHSMENVLASVANLPADSVILYLTFSADAEGRPFVPREALSRIARVANAPVFITVDQYAGQGAVGGDVTRVDALGEQTARIGLRMLRGESAPAIELAAHRNLFDWRQLQRWGMDEKALPPDSVIDHREPSVWSLYKRYIIAGIIVFLSQTALIIGLLVSRTERRRADSAAREADARRQRAEDEVRRQRDELAHALRLTTLGELAASFAHDIGQPLGAILMNAQAVHRQMASRPVTSEELDETLGDIEHDAHRASDTILRLRALFRKQQTLRTPVDMNAIIDDVIRLLHAEMTHKDIHVQFDRGQPLPDIAGDPVQLRQVFLNLLVNAGDAIKREPEGDREIRIETKRMDDDAVGVVVRDTGAGATDADLDVMFERFVSTKPHGLGMGLAISRSIIESHKGSIWATRNEDRGLSLHVRIPAIRNATA